MHLGAIDSVVRQFTKVAEQLICPVGPETGKRILDCAGSIGGYMLSPKGAEAEQALVEQLLIKHEWGKKISERFLNSRLTDVLHSVVEKKNIFHIEEAIKTLVLEIESIEERLVVLVPLAGIGMKDVTEFDLGNVLIRDMSGERAAETIERHRTLTMKNKFYTVEEKQKLFEHYKSYLDRVVGRVCAEFRVVAEPARARELAVEEARRAVDLLRFAVLNLRKLGTKHSVGIQGDISLETLTTVCCAESELRANYSDSLVHETFVIAPPILDKMKALGVFELSDLLKKEQPTDFEELILRGIHWLASAQAQPENENALLNLITCFETFLRPAKGDPITATIAEGVAILTADGLDERKRRKNRIKNFYDLRSRLSHEGRGTILEAELQELTGIARDLVIQMIRRRDEFPTQEALRNWIDDEKLR